MASEMNHWERVRAALKEEETDRVPISLWRHWPFHDETARGLAAATLRWQHEYDFDIVKVNPTGTYGIEDWGARTTYTPNPKGVRTIVQTSVTSVNQWPRLEQLEVTKGYLGIQITALRLIAEGIQDSAPIVMTVLSPTTTARKLAGDRIFTDLRLRPQVFKQGLQIIAETTARFAMESIKAGAHGIFFATQCDSYRLLSEAEYREFGAYYDRIVLNAVRSEAEILLLHAHGDDIMFDLVAGYPVDAINWHDRTTWPSLSEARERFPGMLVGGINEWSTLLEGPPAAIEAEIQEATAQTGGRGFMVGAGCIIPIHTPAANVRVAREAVDH